MLPSDRSCFEVMFPYVDSSRSHGNLCTLFVLTDLEKYLPPDDVHQRNEAAATMSSGHTLEADCLDDTSRTLHEPRNYGDASVVNPMETIPELPVLNQRVAEVANKACQRECAKSKVLSNTNVAEIAMVRFDELEIGVKLGKGSFSDVQ